ncbi:MULTISPECIES: outer membrane lipoprotein MapA [unclassified Campylobacter]|uniref:outer membrane lipoprotein MapA n=1 Tax=unclassified Campylobacter TaxID=2593542 RepID=UPI001237B139|nr:MULTISPECIES: outer membrane lipoprotein MapA [unclassified Campylobacter]KAA6227079.1 hypothetical protein FMM55_03765 [Campylobacter sp. LR196d]KAA6228705.1 hypothetical protein FMM57_02230 [Campylobacter sp. LR286c]
MLKNLILCILAAFLLNACSSNTYSQVNQIANNTQCYSCESSQAFEARIKGLYYVSDMGIKCCASKRTLDSSVAIKKVYLHRFYDLKEEEKVLNTDTRTYLVDVQFHTAFYIYLKQELEARHIEVLDDNNNNSPYVSKIDLSFTGFNSKQDTTGLHSRLVGVLSVKDINKDKKFTLRTKQDVEGFSNLRDISFYTHLLIKQMANKAASLISEL